MPAPLQAAIKRFYSEPSLAKTATRASTPRSDLSGLEKFEGLDPAVWCPKGYAVVSVDARGSGNSDGHVCILGTQEAEDGYDVVEALAKMDWCNGNIGMAGNSWLCVSQWFIAAQQPPSLKAIAPWEGLDDLYRAQFCRGGWFSMHNMDLIHKEIMRGPTNSGLEDADEMYRRCQTMNDYWRDKRVDMSKILCPAYIRGSDVSNLHNLGPVRAWLEIPHEKKWIQWSSYQEWFELYSVPEAAEELTVFFDRYLRGIENGWEKNTPKVRWSALQFGDRPAIHDIELPDFPVPTTEYRHLFASTVGKLANVSPDTAQTVSYDSENPKDWVEFTHVFRILSVDWSP